MKEWLKQLLCKHEYTVAGTVLFKGYTTYFLECMRCRKREVLKSDRLSYSRQLKNIFRMWKKKEIDIDFKGFIDEK